MKLKCQFKKFKIKFNIHALNTCLFYIQQSNTGEVKSEAAHNETLF